MANDIYERIQSARQSLAEAAPAGANSAPGVTGTTASSSVYDRIASARQSLAETESGGRQIAAPTAAGASPMEQAEAKDGNVWDKIKNFAGFTGEKAVSGAVESVEGGVNAFAYLQQLLGKGYEMQAANALGHAGAVSGNEHIKAQAEKQQKEALEHLGEDTRTVADFGNRYAQKVDEKYDTENRSKAGQFVGNVAQGMGGMVPAIVSNLIIPGSGLAVMGSGAIGNAMQEAKAQGKTDSEAIPYAIASGAVEVLTEKLLGGMGGAFGKGALDDALKGAINSKVSSGAARMGLNALASFLGEGAEEFTAEYGSALANRLTIDTDRRTGGELLSDAFYNALVGGAVGGLLNAADIYRSGRNITATEAAEAAAAEINAEKVRRAGGDAPHDGGSKRPPYDEDAIKSGAAGASPRPTEGGILASEGAETQAGADTTETGKAEGTHPDSPGLAKEEILVERDANGNVTVVINADILADKPKTEWRKAISSELQRIFKNGITLPRGTVFSNKKGRGEFTNGSYTKMLERTDPEMYEDKMRMASGADLLLMNAENVAPESPTHDRTDDIVSFNRGNIRVKVRDSGYTGDVLTAIYSDGKETFFDINNLARNKNEATPERYAAGNADGFSQTGDASDARIARPEQEVNIDEGIYGRSVGAATPAVGPMVETQNKAITENINLSEESRAANQPAPHEQISEALSLARAGANIMVDGDGNIVDFENTLDDLLSREKWEGVDSDTAQLLLKEAEKRGDAESVKRIAQRMAKEGTEAAQLLQSRKKWIEAAPANRLAAMYNYVEEFAKEHKAVKNGKIEIPNELAQEYLKASTEAERDEVISKIQKHVASQARSTLLEKWTALRYVNMLGNFKTQIRNISGNLFMKAQYFAKNETAALIEAIANAVSGGAAGRSKSLAVGTEWMQAAKADFANAKDEILSNGKYSGENFKGQFAEGIEDARKILIPGFEQYRRATNWAMDKGDLVFSKAAYARALAGYLKANGAQPQQLMAGNVDAGLLEKARAYAIKQAQEATFRDNNAFSDWVSRIGRREDTFKPAKVLAEGLLPFRRTPANVLLRAEEFSPLGLINTAVKAVQSRKAGSNISASDIIDSLSKSLTGSGLMALGYILADQGLLRAAGSDEDEEFDALMNTQDWSIVIPGVGTYTFDWAAPASLIMFTGAQLSELMSDGELSFADVEGAFTGLSEPLIQMSMLSGVNDTLDSIKFSDNNLIQMAGQLAVGYLSQGLTNTLLGQIERSTEAERMSTYTEADSPLPEWLQRSIGKASAKTPGWDYQQTEYLNEFGETEESTVGERVLENLISPGYFEAEKSGGVYDIVSELRERLGMDVFPDAYPPDSVKHDKESFVLSQEERSRYQETRGQAAADYLEAADRDGNFKRLTSQQQRDILEEILGRANEEAKNEALENRGVEVEQSATEKVIERMTAAQYIDWLVEDATTRTPAGYKSAPAWQEFEKAAEALPEALAISMMIARNEKSGGKINEAVRQGVALDDAVAYYRAITEYNSEGKAPGKAEKQQRIAALGLSWVELDVLGDLFG